MPRGHYSRAPKGFAKELLNTPKGGVFTIKKDKDQTKEQFAKSIQNVRVRMKAKYGILTFATFEGDECKITVREAAPAGIATPMERKTIAFHMRESEPAPAPTPPPAPVVIADTEDAQDFWQEMFLESVRNTPGAPPHIHADNAKAAVVQFQQRWASA